MARTAAIGIAGFLTLSACEPWSVIEHAPKPTVTHAAVKASLPVYARQFRTRLAIPHDVLAPPANAYPWPYAGSGSDPYGMSLRQCTSYVAWYINSHGTPFGHTTRGPAGTGIFINAATWDQAAATAGFVVDQHPTVGSIAQWRANEESRWYVPGGYGNIVADSLGHVAIVTAVYSNGSVDLAQYNWGDSRNFSTLSHVYAPRYIHIPLAS